MSQIIFLLLYYSHFWCSKLWCGYHPGGRHRCWRFRLRRQA